MTFLLLLIAVTDCENPTPTVSFTVEEGLVTAVVQRDDQPIAGALIKVYDGSSGPPLVEGETDDGGRGVFIIPNQAGLVGITIAGKECDLIPVKVVGNSLTPPR
ncbi:MAG: hypothetical protein SNJ82_13325, partial [Gemmataceae bacterium]